MNYLDGMVVIFRDEAQKAQFAALSARPMVPTSDQSCMGALRIEPSIRYLCNQLGWNDYADDVHKTYRNLTLEFLSSLDYNPWVGEGDDRGRINFRLFGTEYTLNIKEFGDLLGFQTGPTAITETPLNYFLSRDIDKFWQDITDGASLDPSTQLSRKIHNPAFRYFEMILCHTFFGRSYVDHLVTAEEVLFLYYASQSRPIASGGFLIESLDQTAQSTAGFIHSEGNVTQIASALGLDRMLFQLTPYCGYTFLDLDFCMDRGLMRRASFHPYQYRLLIDDRTVYTFTLPDPQMTCVSNPANWNYYVEGWGETSYYTPEYTPGPEDPIPEYTPGPEDPVLEYTPGSEVVHTTVLTNNLNLQEHDIHTLLIAMRTEIATLRNEVVDLHLQLELNDASFAGELDDLAHEVAEIRRQLTELRGPDPPVEHPPGW
ncbi:uncharacterized protein LOC131595132 [Vicia villosa]|uniref:uncharacterized protein LOC131595132 n=1 Tax=Vicia villosa TaxID=3911 RepID=UPI00273C3659|nr:uncharacterized protein LOC131595132 [Vicia villosa]